MEAPRLEQRPVIQPQRTFILWFMSICSMLDALSNIFTYLLSVLAPQKMAEMLPQAGATMGLSQENIEKLLETFATITPSQYLMLIGVEVLMFAGALLMIWKLNQIGFHLYAIGQLLNILMMNFVIGGNMTMDFTSILTVVFLIAIYAMHLRYMHRLKDTDGEETDEITENTEQDE
ncbi:MAG: hypothetical protein J6T86_00230 [Bacteroidales bacterium]|nr:hypothetical protein [Bacteroidales bacterium]